MKRWLVLAIFTVGVIGYAVPALAAAKVFLLAGQSNMGGCGVSSELVGPLARYHDAQSRSLIWNNTASQWLPNSNLPAYAWFGPEVSFGYQMQATFPDDNVYLVKWSSGGTSLYADWRPGDNPGWCYAAFKSTAQAAIQNLVDAGQDPQIAGMLWMQGEHDAANADFAPHYQENLINFIAAVRDDFSTPEMPFVLGRIIQGYGTTENNDLVRTAQTTVPTLVSNTFCVNTDDLQQSTNPALHFGTQGQIDLGIRFADKLTHAPEPSAFILLLVGGFTATMCWRAMRHTNAGNK